MFLYIDAGSEFQRLQERLCAHLVDVRARDDLDGTWRFLDLLLCAGCRNDNVIRAYACGRYLVCALRRVGRNGYCTEYGGRQKKLLFHVFVQHFFISKSVF